MDKFAPVTIIELNGDQSEVTFSLNDYREAEEQGLTLAQHINLKFPTNVKKDGTAFAQCMAQTGMLLSQDRHYGIRPPTIHALLEGSTRLAGGAVVAPSGADRLTPAGRLFYPAFLIESMESSLRDDNSAYNQQYMDMVAYTLNIPSARYDQVLIDTSGPRAARGAVISQLSEPQRMLSITTSSISRSLATKSIGLEISKEAAKLATLDLVGIMIREHGLEEHTAQLEEDFLAVVNGDTDVGEAGIIGAAVTAQSYDASILANGELTQKAWVKYLMKDRRKRTLTHAAMNIDTYLQLEARTGRPTKQFEPAVDERLNTTPRITLPLIPGGIKVFIMDSFLANTIVGLDAAKALRRVVFTGASFTGIQEFVMRGSTAMRIDWAERIESIGYANAFHTMTLTV